MNFLGAVLAGVIIGLVLDPHGFGVWLRRVHRGFQGQPDMTKAERKAT